MQSSDDRTDLPRTLEPESMDSAGEVAEYLAMAHGEVNGQFVEDLFANGPVGDRVMDFGCGTAAIPILICHRVSDIKVMGLDSSLEMLEAARLEIEMEGVVDQVQLQHVDCKAIPEFESESAATVISNSFLHHLAGPLDALREMTRVLEPDGRLFVRDLARPSSADEVEELVLRHAGHESAFAQQLLRQSLHAALTRRELAELLASVGVPESAIALTSDRHLTVDWRKPTTA